MKKRNIAALLILSAIILALAFFQTPLMSSARGVTWSLWVNTIGRWSGLGSPDAFTTVFEENAQLAADNVRLRAELRDYRRLREELADPPFDDLRIISAAVVGRPIDTWGSKYVINKGIRDGVTLNAPATIYGSVLVGFVRELNETTSVIELLYSPTTNLAIETTVADEETPIARGLLEARHYISLLMTTVPRDRPLTEGQTVVTTGREGAVPFGLVVGTVSNIENIENEAYQLASVVTPYDIDDISAVHILVAP